MCGLFGFYGTQKPDQHTLARIAHLAAKRGCDGWGVVTEFGSQHDLGRLTNKAIRDLPPSRMVIGHCRLATVLDTKRRSCCQPIRVGRFLVAHNGTVGNVTELADQYGFKLDSGVDSEAIGHVMAAKTGDIATRLAETLAEIDHSGHYALAILDADTQSIHLRARNMPLFRLTTPAGVYWCSIRPDFEWETVHG